MIPPTEVRTERMYAGVSDAYVGGKKVSWWSSMRMEGWCAERREGGIDAGCLVESWMFGGITGCLVACELTIVVRGVRVILYRRSIE